MATIVITTFGLNGSTNNTKREILKTEAKALSDNSGTEEDLVLEYLRKLSCVKYHQNKALIDGLKSIMLDEQTEIGINSAQIRSIKKHKPSFLLSKENREKIELLEAENQTLFGDIKCKKRLVKSLTAYTDEELKTIYTNALENELGFKKIDESIDEVGFEAITYECKDLNTELVLEKMNELASNHAKNSEEIEEKQF